MPSKTGLALKISQLIDQTQELTNTYKPVFFKLDNQSQRDAFESLIQNQKNIQNRLMKLKFL